MMTIAHSGDCLQRTIVRRQRQDTPTNKHTVFVIQSGRVMDTHLSARLKWLHGSIAGFWLAKEDMAVVLQYTAGNI
jgi:hypothetical protein